MIGSLWRITRGQYKREFPGSEPVSRPWHAFMIILWVFVGIALFVSVRALYSPEESDLLPDTGVFLVVIVGVTAFIVLRRFVAVWVARVTYEEVREHDLWRGERYFLTGGVGLYLFALAVVHVFGFSRVENSMLFTVLVAVMVVSPLTEWIGRKPLSVTKIWVQRLDERHLLDRPSSGAADDGKLNTPTQNGQHKRPIVVSRPSRSEGALALLTAAALIVLSRRR